METSAMDGDAPKRKVVVVEPGYEDYAVERSILTPLNAAIAPLGADADAQTRAEALRTAHAILVREATIDAAVIGTCENCQIIVRYGVGVDNVDLDAARARRIPVANVPDYGADEVSDHALALMLATARHVVRRDRDVRRGVWAVGQKEKIYGFRDRVVGLVGYGKIARSLHDKLKPFGPSSVLVCDPFLEVRAAAAAGVETVGIDDMCRRADIISLHAPLTARTRHLIGAAQIALMKPTTLLVNTARGGLIDEAALAAALAEKRLSGAGIDVFEQEPPDPANPLLSLDNVVLSDHGGWYSERSVGELQTKAAGEIARVFRGEPPKNWVNRWDD